MNEEKNVGNESNNKGIFDYVQRTCQFSFELEEKREESLINQSARIMEALSFVTAALGVIFTCVLDNIQSISKVYIFFSAGLIAIGFIASFILALIAQWRFKYQTLPLPSELFENFKNHYETISNDLGRLQDNVYFLNSIQKSKKDINDKRAKFISASMICSLVAIGLFILFTFIAIGIGFM